MRPTTTASLKESPGSKIPPIIIMGRQTLIPAYMTKSENQPPVREAAGTASTPKDSAFSDNRPCLLEKKPAAAEASADGPCASKHFFGEAVALSPKVKLPQSLL